MRTNRRRGRSPFVAVALLAVAVLVGCGEDDLDPRSDPGRADRVEPPEVGACRLLTPADVAEASDATEPVDCGEEHTAQTFAVGPLPDELEDAERDDERLGAFAYRTCSEAFGRFLGADESVVMRTVVSWAWFRPSEQAWAEGARWYRCDLVGGGEESEQYLPLPPDAAGLLSGVPDDAWMACVRGESVSGAPRVPCSEPHDWRAVTTIKVGEPGDPYPGDRLVEVKTRDYCSSSVGAWLDYPATYDFAYTWFHEAEWEAGNRRSVCWARTAG